MQQSRREHLAAAGASVEVQTGVLGHPYQCLVAARRARNDRLHDGHTSKPKSRRARPADAPADLHSRMPCPLPPRARVHRQPGHDSGASDHSGVNIAPALAAADVGLAMSSGTDIAIEGAGITLLNGDLTGVVRGCQLSHATMSNIRQNPGLRLHLQRRWHPHRSWRPIPHVRPPALTDHRSGRYGPVLGQRHHQRPKAPITASLSS